MTSIGELIGSLADEIVQDAISVGDVHKITLDESNGITPKDGEAAREKFFIVLGLDASGNVIGGIVINSSINYNLPTSVTDYQMPVSCTQLPFLHHNSFVNCSRLIIAHRSKFSKDTYRGSVDDKELLTSIVETVKESPTVSKRRLREFGLL